MMNSLKWTDKGKLNCRDASLLGVMKQKGGETLVEMKIYAVSDMS